MNRFRKWAETATRHRWFLIGVVLPVLVSAVYFFLIASDQYVSESRFVIKAPNQRTGQISTFANLIQTTGLSAGQEQSNQVIDYVRSRSALQALSKEVPLVKIYSSDSADILSRFPKPWQENAREDLHEFYQEKVVIDRDVDTGLVVLRTIAFHPKDAALINEMLLRQSETLVNDLNERARRSALSETERRMREAEQRATAARGAMAIYRNKVQLVDPLKQAGGVLEITDRLITERSVLTSQLSTLKRVTPDHPSISALRERIASLTQEIDGQTARILGGANTISGKLPEYEALALEQELSSQLVVVARASLEQARSDALKQQFYLERVVEPNVPDRPKFPNAWRSVLTILGFALCLYFIFWMLLVGILEHAQEG
jgi:capsular polysaccharide transport system permease protein